MAREPGRKDLPSKKDVKGGRIIRNDNLTLVRLHESANEHSPEERMAPRTKDLSTKKDVKGGGKQAPPRLGGNDNLTLVRAAKPAKKDLPAGKDVKGGKKAR